VTVFVRPTTSPLVFEYGVVDTTESDAWLWRGQNGTFRVAPGSTAPVTAPGQVFAAFGTRDVRIVLDLTVAELTASAVRIKGSAWGWIYVRLTDDGMNGDAVAGDNRYTFQLRRAVGPGTAHPHLGLLSTGDQCQFLFELDGVEYREAGAGGVTGVTAAVSNGAGSFTPVSVRMLTNLNTAVDVP
jgi:hypothetical protein